MAFTGYNIFPGLTMIGVVDPAVAELAVVFNTEALSALQSVPDKQFAWADIAGVTAASLEAKIPLDLTALDGFEPYDGTRHFKKVEISAIRVDVQPYTRNLEWPLALVKAPAQLLALYNLSTMSANMIRAARMMKARIAATILMQGTPSTAKALVYPGTSIAGAGLSLFNTAHLSNPRDGASRTFSNYHAAAGTFSTTSYAAMLKDMRTVPSLGSAETLGCEVTDVIGPSLMEEPFNAVAHAPQVIQALLLGGQAVAAGVTNIYANKPIRYWIAPQLDGDPYVTANPGKHMWFTLSRDLPGAHPIEMAAPTKEFTPEIKLFGDGSEMAATSRMIRLMADLDAGAAPGLPHIVHRYEETA